MTPSSLTLSTGPNRLAASAVSIVMLSIAFTLVRVVDWLQHRRPERAE